MLEINKSSLGSREINISKQWLHTSIGKYTVSIQFQSGGLDRFARATIINKMWNCSDVSPSLQYRIQVHPMHVEAQWYKAGSVKWKKENIDLGSCWQRFGSNQDGTSQINN